VNDEGRQRLALLVGIDRYRHLPPSRYLRGAVRDAEAMADLLEQRFRFGAAQIRLLRDEEATRGAAWGALEALAERADEGTVVVILWSSHGSRIASTSPGDGPGGGLELDETLVPHDARGEGVGDLRDKELLPLLARLARRGAFVTWIADTCHSGHLYRNTRFGRARFLPPQPPLPLPLPAPMATAAGAPFPAGRHQRQVLLAACRADQQAYERPFFADEAHGEWTFALLSVLRDAPPQISAREVARRASLRLLAEGVPQLPQVIGASDRQIFGVEARPPVRFVEVRGREGQRVTLGAGRAQGLVEASLWRAQPAGNRTPNGDDLAPQLEVVRVGAFSSEAELVGRQAGQPEVEAGDWAFEVEPAYGELRLPVQLLADSPSERWEQLAARIRASPVLRVCAAEELDRVTVELVDGRCSLTDSRGLPLLPARPLDETGAGDTVLQRLTRRARCRHGLRLENRDPSSRVGACLRAEVLRRDATGRWSPAVAPPATAASQLPYPEIRCGESIALEISHTFPGDLHLCVLDFGLTDRVVQLFPAPGGEERVPPGVTVRPGTAAGDELDLWLPPEIADGTDGTEVLKVFATTEATSFDWLCTEVDWPATRRAAPRSLARLLAMGAAGPVVRGSREDWGTVLLPMLISAP
jgi:hypothetical protein